MKTAITWAAAIVFIILASILLWSNGPAGAYEDCATVPGHDAEERMDNVRDCREANALERIADNTERGDR